MESDEHDSADFERGEHTDDEDIALGAEDEELLETSFDVFDNGHDASNIEDEYANELDAENETRLSNEIAGSTVEFTSHHDQMVRHASDGKNANSFSESDTEDKPHPVYEEEECFFDQVDNLALPQASVISFIISFRSYTISLRDVWLQSKSWPFQAHAILFAYPFAPFSHIRSPATAAAKATLPRAAPTARPPPPPPPPQPPP